MTNAPKFLGSGLRIGLLGMLTLGVGVVVVRSLFFPPPPRLTTQAGLDYPDAVTLSRWQLVTAEPYDPSTLDPSLAPDAYQYRYQQGDRTLEATVAYVTHPFVNETYFRMYSPTLINIQIHETDQQGFYGVVTRQDHAELHACVRPRGHSVILYPQLARGADVIDWRLSHLWKWMMGQSPLRDYRCLWTTLRLPLEGRSPDDAYGILESVWPEWRSHWSQTFPPL
jgi:cyanosortase A-associated protein